MHHSAKVNLCLFTFTYLLFLAYKCCTFSETCQYPLLLFPYTFMVMFPPRCEEGGLGEQIFHVFSTGGFDKKISYIGAGCCKISQKRDFGDYWEETRRKEGRVIGGKVARDIKEKNEQIYMNKILSGSGNEERRVECVWVLIDAGHTCLSMKFGDLSLSKTEISPPPPLDESESLWHQFGLL